MKWRDAIVHRIRRWLQIDPDWSRPHSPIRETYTHDEEIMCHRIWYRGDADELQQFYKHSRRDGASASRFWAAVPYGDTVRKIHSGLPAKIVDTLAGIVLSDYDGADFGDEEDVEERWERLEKAVAFSGELRTAIRETLITGDGAFKVSWDTTQLAHPILEFYSADRVEYRYCRGALTGIAFFTNYDGDRRDTYQLEELYEWGKISYTLYGADGKTVSLDKVPQLASLQDVQLPAGMMAAVPVRFFDNSRRPQRGGSIFAGKTDVFDAHDEVVSQWLDAIRCGRVQKYIPVDMIPKNPENGKMMPVDSFGTTFVQVKKTGDDTEPSKIDTVQPEIRYEAFLQSYSSTLDMCLQGILSPATLGINISAVASGASQRERKDITGFTRNQITGVLEDALPAVISLLLQVEDWINHRPVGKYSPTVSFGEYAAPDFSSRAATIQAAAGAGIMSIEAQVEELWGGSKDDEWIRKEVRRIKFEKGIEIVEEPSGKDDLP